MKKIVLSLGGSLICPNGVDVNFLKKFKQSVLGLVSKGYRFIIICGGGMICRDYQESARIFHVGNDDLDWIGIMTSRVNAELVRSLFSDIAFERVVYNPKESFSTNKPLIIGAGFKPGSSTDLRAVELAKRFGAATVINMSNVKYVYSADPKLDKKALKIKKMSWKEFSKLVGKSWKPGANLPFDPIAALRAAKNKQTVFIIGSDLNNFKDVVEGKKFKGTIIK